MRSIKNIIFAVVIILLLGGEVYYMMTVYQTEANIIAQNREEIRLTELRIEELEKRVAKLPETEKELELVTNQKQAILNMLPAYTALSKNMAEIFRYLEINDFVDISYKSTENNGTTASLDGIRTYQYNLSFVGPYDEAIAFIHNLNQSYQVINVENLTLDNSVQDPENTENLVYYRHYGDKMPEVIRTSLQVTMYSRYDAEAEKEEIYQPDLRLEINDESIFAFRSDVKQIGTETETLALQDAVASEEVMLEVLPKQAERPNDVFTLHVGDRITSGDTYKLDGPGSNIGDYVGLSSQANVVVDIEVFADHYTMSIEDENGEKESTEVVMTLTEPYLEVISTMRPLEEVMPNVHINIHNHTEMVMPVKLSGTMLDNIYVFNDQGERITQENAQGNITLT